MRTLIVAVAVAIALGFAVTSVQAADQGQVAPAALASLGLGGMQPVSDVQGEQVRGKWFYSTIPGSLALNTYLRLNALPGAKIPVVQFHPGTGPFDPAFVIPAGFENQVARSFRISVETVNLIYATRFPAGIPGTPFGPANPVVK